MPAMISRLWTQEWRPTDFNIKDTVLNLNVSSCIILLSCHIFIDKTLFDIVCMHMTDCPQHVPVPIATAFIVVPVL